MCIRDRLLGIVTPVGAFRSPLRLVIVLSPTLSRNPPLLLLVPKAIILIIPEPQMYATIVRNLGTSWLAVANYALDVSVSRKRLQCS